MATRNPLPVIGLKGFKRSGKSYVAAELRRQVRAPLHGRYDAGDIEFSDPITEAANLALADGKLRFDPFRFALAQAAAGILGVEVPAPMDFYCTCGANTASQCPEHVLEQWLARPAVTPKLVITRNTKDDHRAVLIWLGVVVRQLVDERVWAREVGKRIKYAQIRHTPLITVGGVRFPDDAAEVRRHGAVIVAVVGPPTEGDDDPTNALSDGIEPDATIYNQVWESGALEATVAEFLADLKAGQLKPEYGPKLEAGS